MLPDALRRELAEELRRDVGQAEGGELLWVVDQSVSRPGPTPPPRKLHLIYRCHVTAGVRATLAEQELDELADGSHEVGTVVWIDYCQTADLPLFPPVGAALLALTSPRAHVAGAELPARHGPELSLGLKSRRLHPVGPGPSAQSYAMEVAS